MVAIQIKDLSRDFGQTRVLDHINLRIEPGEMFFLLGPSGCGKTTLLRHMAGFYQPDSGSVWFGDRDVTHVPPHQRGTAMMFQSYALWPHLSVAENVAFGLEERKRPRTEIQTRVQEALDRVQLNGLGERRIQQLSGGQQQRVALARALVVRPHCLLLDEPLSNLDAKLRWDMRNEIRRICKDSGLTAVYVTHDQEEALSMADRLAVMSAGQLVQVGTPWEVYRNPLNQLVAGFIGKTNLLTATVLRAGSQPGSFELEVAGSILTGRISHTQWQPAVGATVYLSVRPEALMLNSSPHSGNCFSGQLVNAVYLGSTIQYELRLPDGVALTITELNPAAGIRPSGESASATVASNDLIILPN